MGSIMSNAETAQVIVNPIAGNSKCGRSVPLLIAKLLERGITHELTVSRYSGQVRELALQAKEQGCERIIVCGGDGTINEAINALADSDVKLGVLPLGTGNDFARTLGIIEDLDFACNVLRDEKVRKVDLVKVNGNKYYGSVGGIGFDAEVASWANRYKRFAPGTTIYLLAILAKLFTYKFKRVAIAHDTGNHTGEILMAAIGNTEWYGGGINITPSAVMDDGVLDICVVQKINKLKLLLFFPSVLKGTHARFSEVKLYRTKKISISSETPLQLLGDGEILGETPVSLEVIPQALNIIAP
jgi:YegS/Rv2252/BmrU family lipid kinase